MSSKQQHCNRNIRVDARAFLLLDCVKNGLAQPRFSDVTGMHRANVLRRLRTFERQNLVWRREKGKPQFWELTKDGLALHQTLQTVFSTATPLKSPKFRWHALLFTFKYVRGGSVWRSSLQEKGWVASSRHNYGGWQRKREGITFFASPKSVWVMFRQPARTVRGAVALGLRRAFEARDWLENSFPGLRLAGDARLCRQHLAAEGGPSLILPKGFRYQSDVFVVDASTGKLEIESVSNSLAHEDMGGVMKALEFFARNPAALDTLRVLAGQAGSGAVGRDSGQRGLEGYA